ncbi:hypothetical protein [Nannocystis pusilla]|uniref:G domain-containing protein n=1 Tax=Nannocystis pusilla TaxID=889268 RepID=A0ABS7U1M9_9BACT|nr:hypothetical protein [Nannocystis pusilla]MBZ5714250.1 hypothetical protein [Nannocystis pusilla]
MTATSTTRRRRLIALLALQAGTFFVTILALMFAHPPEAFVPAIQALSLVVVLLGALTGRVLFSPPKPWLDAVAETGQGRETPECRVLLIGLGRSGKTSLIRQVLTGTTRAEQSTKTFNVYRAPRVTDLGGARFDIVLADYQGQKLSQLVIDPPISFFGPPGDRRINAIIFVVDLFRERRDAVGNPVCDAVLLEQYSHDTGAQIQERVDEQCKYISEFTIEIILETTFNRRQVCSIILVVNKIDLLRILVERGCLEGVSSSNMEHYVSNLYAPLLNLLREAARANEVEGLFGAYLVSARTGENVAVAFSEILRRFQLLHWRGSTDAREFVQEMAHG